MIRVAAALLLLVCPLTFAADVAGHYYLRGVMEVGSELLLKPDGTFEYMLAYGAADYFAKGNWKVDGDAVVLTTAGKEAPPFRLVKATSEKTPGLRVWVQAPNGRPVEHIEVVLNTDKGAVTRSTSPDGVALFGDTGVPKSVQLNVRVYSVEAGPYPIEAGRNDIHFEINGEAITRVPFKDERLKISGKTLEMRFWDKDRVMKYEKE